tara:strand:- start:32 stop:1000 length:969 start_codon:yes stop_codon:yes gene_type:complete
MKGESSPPLKRSEQDIKVGTTSASCDTQAVTDCYLPHIETVQWNPVTERRKPRKRRAKAVGSSSRKKRRKEETMDTIKLGKMFLLDERSSDVDCESDLIYSPHASDNEVGPPGVGLPDQKSEAEEEEADEEQDEDEDEKGNGTKGEQEAQEEEGEEGNRKGKEGESEQKSEDSGDEYDSDRMRKGILMKRMKMLNFATGTYQPPTYPLRPYYNGLHEMVYRLHIQFYPFIRGVAEIDLVEKLLRKKGEFVLTNIFHPRIIEASVYNAIFPMSVRLNNQYFSMALKLHRKRCILNLNNFKPSKSVVKRSKDYYFSLNSHYDQV